MVDLEQLNAVWPEDCDLTELDAEAVEALAGAIARLCESLGPVRAGYLLFALGKKIALSEVRAGRAGRDAVPDGTESERP